MADGKGIPLEGDRAAWDAENYAVLHTNDSDTATGIHHTLGTGATNAAAGNHTHDAVTTYQTVVFSVEGALTVGAKALRLYNATGASRTISKVFVAVNTAPTGAAIIIDIHKDGATIFSNQATRPQIAAGSNTGTVVVNDSWATDSYLTLEIDQVGSTIAGSDLTVHIISV